MSDEKSLGSSGRCRKYSSDRQAPLCMPVHVREDPNYNYHLGILMQYLEEQCRSAKKPSQTCPTHFHSVYEPSVTIREYVSRIGRYSRCSRECFIIALILLDRYQRNTGYQLCSLNVHRLMITALLVAVKSSDDVFQSNKYWNDVGGLPDREIHFLERFFLKDIKWMTYIDREEYNWYLTHLARMAPSCFYMSTLPSTEEAQLPQEGHSSKSDQTETTMEAEEDPKREERPSMKEPPSSSRS